MALNVTVTSHWWDGKRIHAIGTIVATGNYATGGDILDLSDFSIKSNRVPLFVDVIGIAGYDYRYVNGTTIANGKLMAFQNGAVTSPAAELAAAAYPAGALADTIKFHAIFRK